MSAYEANGELSKLIDRLEAGEQVVIRRNGKDVARLVRAGAGAPPSTPAAEAISHWRELRRDHRLSLGGLSLRELIDEGRR